MGYAPGMDALKALIREVPDFPKPGIRFYDVTPVLADPKAFSAAVAALAAPCEGQPVTHVVGIESRGFIFGAAMAAQRGWGFVPVRKPGKLPRPVFAEAYGLEYRNDVLQIHRDALGPQDTVLIVDDLLATGGTLEAAIKLVRHTGARIVGASVCIELTSLQGRMRLSDIACHALLRY
jgi:adenine phosphoribosyltransferase